MEEHFMFLNGPYGFKSPRNYDTIADPAPFDGEIGTVELRTGKDVADAMRELHEDRRTLEPVPLISIPVIEYAELLANTERGVFWKQVAEKREDCFAKMVRAQVLCDQNGQDFEDAFEELEAANKKIEALEASRDEWMTLARDAHGDSKKFVASANSSMVERNKALTQRNAALFFVGLLAGGHLINTLFAMGAL